MPVYLARFGSDGPVKIGYSAFVQWRLDMIQARLWDDLKLFRLLQGTEEDERALHRRFAHLRIRFEWFTYSPDMLGDLGLPDLGSDPTRSLTGPNPRNHGDTPRSSALRAWMVREGLHEHDLAELLECTRGTVAGWLFYGHRPQARIVKRLIFLSDGELSAAYGTPDPRWRPQPVQQAA